MECNFQCQASKDGRRKEYRKTFNNIDTKLQNILMVVVTNVMTILFLMKTIEPLNILQEQSRPLSVQRRGVRQNNLAKVRDLFKLLTKETGNNNVNRVLRTNIDLNNDDVNLGVREEQAGLIEKELKDALSQKKSALLDNPYVTKQGRNDFLVMRPEIADPYVTIIPNAIYYNIEKKCVNWLDDCSLKGIRARLLSGVQSPYK